MPRGNNGFVENSFLRAGGDVFSLQYLLGHTTLQMTQGYLQSLNANDAMNAHKKGRSAVEDRTVLLSDNGPGYLSRQFNNYLRVIGIRHILASPHHPQSNGKIERYHRTIKGALSLVPYELPSALKEAIRAFIEYYNYQRYHEGLGDVTPHDVYTGRYLEVIQRRKEAKSRTLLARRDYNRVAREQGSGL